MAKKKTIKIEEPVELKKAPLLRNNVPDPVPSVLSGLLRFSPDHIVRLIYDPDSKAFVLGDLSQNLVTNGVMGESGGASPVPKLTMTVINHEGVSDNLGFTMSAGVCAIVDGHVYQSVYYSIEDNETKVIEVIVAAAFDWDNQVYYYYFEPGSITQNGATVTVSDITNGTWDNDNQSLYVTDPSKDVTCTLTLTPYGGDGGDD